MDIEALERAANVKLFEILGVPATVWPPQQHRIPTRVVIDRDSRVVGQLTGIEESRCEIGLEVSVVGEVQPGTEVEISSSDERWTLMEPISNDGYEHRWVAVRGDY